MPADELSNYSDEQIVEELLVQALLLLQAYRTRAHTLSTSPDCWNVHAVPAGAVQATFDLLKAVTEMGLISPSTEGRTPWI